jgi:putative FmdB family regulatory protein
VPTYSYVCTECETPLEVQQSFSDDALTVCPTCEGRLRKVFSAVGVVFKGSGFYRTDSRAGNGTSGGDSGGDSGGTSTKDGDAAAKPAAAKESGGAAKADAGSGSATKSSKAGAAASSGGPGGSSSASKTGSAA